MMDLPKLIILDVAHGNCSILYDTQGVIIIDCAHCDTLIETLRNFRITEIEHIIISHADQDHFKGFIDLLLDESIIIKNVYLNPDSLKRTYVFMALRLAIKEAKEKHKTKHEHIDIDKTGQLDVGKVRVEVLAPNKNIMGYSGSKDLTGRNLTSNSVSVVIRLVYQSHGVALLSGDIDRVGLENLLTDNDSIQSSVLVFPHHGGNMGVGKKEDNQAFTTLLCQQVKPKLVIFSIGREKHNNPRQEIVEAVIQTLPGTHVLCTQLSKKCCSSDGLLQVSSDHLTLLPSKGKELNHCCGGTIVIDLSKTQTEYEPNLTHRNFVENHVHTPLCKTNS